MNQEQNNLNPNNFNTQGNNGIPNNQPLNNQSFNQGMGFNQQPINPQPQPTPSFQQPINQMNMQPQTPQPMNAFESGNASNQNFNSKPPKKMNLGLIIGIVAIVVVVGVGVVFGSKLLSNNSGNQDNNSVTENNNDKINNEISDKGFYVVSGTQDKGSLAMATNFESEKVNGYNYIEKYNIKWVTEGQLFIMPVPTIPNRTYSLNRYYQSDVEMNSDVLDLSYSIFNQDEFKGSKSEVETLLKNSITEYSKADSYYKLNKNTDVIEKNGVLGYAYSIKTVYSNQIRAWYYIKINNSISSNNYYLAGFISFDSNNYENAKPIIDELSNTIDFNIIDLINQVK